MQEHICQHLTFIYDKILKKKKTKLMLERSLIERSYEKPSSPQNIECFLHKPRN